MNYVKSLVCVWTVTGFQGL